MTVYRRRMGSRVALKLALPLIVCCLLFAGSALATATGAPVDWGTKWHGWSWAHGKHWSDVSYGRGGWSIGLFLPDLGRFNDKLRAHGFGTFDGGIIIVGGGGFGAFDEWKIGGFGGGGRLIAKGAGEDHAALSVGFGLAEVSRMWASAGSRFQVGFMFGGGGASLQLSDRRPDWADDPFEHRYDTLLDQGFFLVGPSVGWEADVNPHVEVVLKAGYLFSIAEPWEHRASGRRFKDLPDLAGPFLSVGFAFGSGRY